MRRPWHEFRDLAEPRNVTLVSATHGVNEFFSIAIPPIIPFLVADLEITFAQAGLLLTVFFLMYSIFQLPAGLLADRVGKKRLLAGGLVVMVAGIALAATAQNYPMLVLAQVVAGIGGATYHPTGMALISDFETTTTEGKAMGVFGFGGMIGVATAPLLIGGLAEAVSWRVGLAAAASLGLAFTAGFILLFAEPEDRQARAIEDGGDRQAQPSTQLDRVRNLLRVPVTLSIVLLLLLTVLVSLQTRAIMTFTTSFVSASGGQSVGMANVVFFAMLAAGSISSLAAGSLADRFSRWRLGLVVSAVTGVLLVAAYPLAVGGVRLPEWALLALLLVLFSALGLAMYACVPVKNALISQEAEREYSASLFGLTQTASAIGSASGPAIFGFLATEASMDVAFPFIAVTSGLMVLAFVLLSRSLE